MPKAMPSASAAPGSGSARFTAVSNRACAQAIQRSGDGPPGAVTNTCGDVAIASTSSCSSVAAESAPGRRSNGRRPDASISTLSPGDSAGINGPLTSTPPVTRPSVSASDRWLASMIAVGPVPGSALRTVPSITTGRTPRWPSIEPGPGTITADAPRTSPSDDRNGHQDERNHPARHHRSGRSSAAATMTHPAGEPTSRQVQPRRPRRSQQRSLPRRTMPNDRRANRQGGSLLLEHDPQVVLESRDRCRIHAEIGVELAHRGERAPLLAVLDDLRRESGRHPRHRVDVGFVRRVDVELGCRCSRSSRTGR